MTCLFCQFANKELETTIVFENDHVLAFPDIAPQAPHHFLVIPKQHIESLNALTPESSFLLGEMALAAKALAQSHGFDDTGWRSVINCGEDGGQTVFHLHMHVLAGRHLTWPPG